MILRRQRPAKSVGVFKEASPATMSYTLRTSRITLRCLRLWPDCISLKAHSSPILPTARAFSGRTFRMGAIVWRAFIIAVVGGVSLAAYLGVALLLKAEELKPAVALLRRWTVSKG